MVLRGLKLVTIGEQTQYQTNWTTPQVFLVLNIFEIHNPIVKKKVVNILLVGNLHHPLAIQNKRQNALA